MRACTCTVAPPGCRVSVVTSRASVAGHRALLGRGQLGVRKHLRRSGFHQRGQIRRAPRGVLPDVAAVGRGHVGARHHHRAVAGEPGVEPVRLAPEPGRRDVGVSSGLRPSRTACGSRGRGRTRTAAPSPTVIDVDLVLLARQRRDQLRVVQPGGRRGQANLHERHRDSAPARGTWCDRCRRRCGCRG